MTLPRWTVRLVGRLAPEDCAVDLLGDLEEAHEALEISLDVILSRRRGSTAGISLLDLKLSVRMLGRYPGLTLVGGIAMAFATWVGAGSFEMLYQVVRPRLPVPGGTRLVGIRVVDAATRDREGRLLFDLEVWRDDLESVESLNWYSTVRRNVALAGAGSFGPDGELGYTPQRAAAAAAYAVLMRLVCASVCIVPTRRALAVEPTEALKAEG